MDDSTLDEDPYLIHCILWMVKYDHERQYHSDHAAQDDDSPIHHSIAFIFRITKKGTITAYLSINPIYLDVH